MFEINPEVLAQTIYAIAYGMIAYLLTAKICGKKLAPYLPFGIILVGIVSGTNVVTCGIAAIVAFYIAAYLTRKSKFLPRNHLWQRWKKKNSLLAIRGLAKDEVEKNIKTINSINSNNKKKKKKKRKK